MKIFAPGPLRELIASIFVGTGAPAGTADEVAAVLVDNNLAGHDSHGLLRVPQYVSAIRQGTIVPTARPEVVQETPATAVVSGNWTFGQLAANFAADIAIEKASSSGVAAVALVDVNHTGRLAAFTERGARRKVVMFMTSGSGAEFITAPYGGREPALGTNPIAFTVPNGDAAPITLDYATSSIAAGKIKAASARGEQLPLGAVVTKDGLPTTEPEEYFNGGFLLPFGAHKGYALAVIAELLSGALVGAGQNGDATRRRTGVFIFAVRSGAFRSEASYRQAVASIVTRLGSVPPAEGFEKVFVPGELEDLSRSRRLREGIPVPDRTWQEIVRILEEFGIPHEAPA